MPFLPQTSRTRRVLRRLAQVPRNIRFQLTHRGPARTFRVFYERNFWAQDESRSGPGSVAEQTALLVEELPLLLRRHGIMSVLDVPCGDWAWMQNVDLTGIDYVGGDVVPALIAENNARYARQGVRFEVIDLTVDDLPPADVILVRDCLVHLAEPYIWMALERIRRSKCRYVLSTTYPEHAKNPPVRTGLWRAISLTHPPFSFPPPIDGILEGCTEDEERRTDKTLALWRVGQIPPAPTMNKWRITVAGRQAAAAARRRLWRGKAVSR